MANDTRKFPAGPIAVVLLLLTAASFAFARFVVDWSLVFQIATSVAMGALTCLLFGVLFPAGTGKKRVFRVLAAALCPLIVVQGGVLAVSPFVDDGIAALIVLCVYWVLLLIVTAICLAKGASAAKKGAKAFVAAVLALTFLCSVFSSVTVGLSVNWRDTKSAYLKRLAQVPYANTQETALPQTAIYTIINDFLHAPLPAGKTEKKVIVIGYDGCRADMLAMAEGPETGAILRVAEQGSLMLGYCGGVPYPAKNTQDTSTAPGWCTMLTGVWADVHGVTGNGMPKSNDHLTLLTTAVEDGTVDSSAFYVSWGGHFSNHDSTYINELNYITEKGLNVTFLRSETDDAGTRENVLADIAKPDCSDFIFSIFEYCDHTGHDTGFSPDNPDYREAFKNAETTGSEIIDAIESRPTYATEDWLILLTTDHGGFSTWHGLASLQERMIFIAANKPLDGYVA